MIAGFPTVALLPTTPASATHCRDSRNGLRNASRASAGLWPAKRDKVRDAHDLASFGGIRKVVELAGVPSRKELVAAHAEQATCFPVEQAVAFIDGQNVAIYLCFDVP
jgi:hypothetical protein